jgi:hypothetical protein
VCDQRAPTAPTLSLPHLFGLTAAIPVKPQIFPHVERLLTSIIGCGAGHRDAGRSRGDQAYPKFCHCKG